MSDETDALWACISKIDPTDIKRCMERLEGMKLTHTKCYQDLAKEWKEQENEQPK